MSFAKYWARFQSINSTFNRIRVQTTRFLKSQWNDLRIFLDEFSIDGFLFDTFFSSTEINLFPILDILKEKKLFFTKSFCLDTCFVETISFSSASRHVREKKINDVRCAIFLWYTHCKHLYCRRSSSLESRIIETKINRANQNISNEFVN